MTGDMYMCVSVTGNFLHVHSLKYHIIKVSNRKRLSALGRMQRLDDLCLLLSTDIDPPDGQNPMLDSEGSQQKGAGSVFQSGGSQITGGGSES